MLPPSFTSSFPPPSLTNRRRRRRRIGEGKQKIIKE